jgi:hypothetical protein|tara:strand:- start:453 stop:656 length:204 start_codon:yes stop_codon:yes gene_type:complete
MIIEIINFMIGIVILCFMAYGCWISSVILSERNKLRKITGMYYDFEIEQELKRLGITKEEALAKGET